MSTPRIILGAWTGHRWPDFPDDAVLLDFSSRRVVRAGLSVRLGPRSFMVVAALLAANGRQITARALDEELLADDPSGGPLYGIVTRHQTKVRPALRRLGIILVAENRHTIAVEFRPLATVGEEKRGAT